MQLASISRFVSDLHSQRKVVAAKPSSESSIVQVAREFFDRNLDLLVDTYTITMASTLLKAAVNAKTVDMKLYFLFFAVAHGRLYTNHLFVRKSKEMLKN